MKLHEYIDGSQLRRLIAEGFITCRTHPTLPLSIYNYTKKPQTENYWPHEVCACRGLITDGFNNIIARPMYKFFNFDTQATVLTPKGPISQLLDLSYLNSLDLPVITDKMDGMMGVLWEYEGQWGIATRGSFASEGALWATSRFQKFVKYGATEFIPKGWTLIFEIVAKHLRIVLPYPYDDLVLLTAINNETGEEASYDRLEEIWKGLNSLVQDKPWCRLVPRFDIDVEACIANADTGREGFVVSYPQRLVSPVKVKIKLEEYRRLHRIITQVSPRKIWEELSDPLKTWLQPEHDKRSLPPEFQEWLKEWSTKLQEEFHHTLAAVMRIEHAVSQISVQPPLSDQEIHEACIKIDPVLGPLANSLMKGKIASVYASIWAMVRPCGNNDPRYPREAYYTEGQGESADVSSIEQYQLR